MDQALVHQNRINTLMIFLSDYGTTCLFSSLVATIIPYNSDYSLAESGYSYVASTCNNISSNGVEGCSSSIFNALCDYNPLSVRCEKG